MTPEVLAARLARARAAMSAAGVDALLLSLGADLPWLSGYTAMPLERLTMLVVPADGAEPVLVVPQLEAPRVVPVPSVLAVRPWGETEDPVRIVSDLVCRSVSHQAGRAPIIAVSDQAWAVFVLRLQESLPKARWLPASAITSGLRAVKEPSEVEALARAAAAADRVAAALLAGDVRLVGQTERQVSAALSSRLIAEGHEHVNFAIVASGPHSASPHHEPTHRVIEPDEPVVCDFGGSLDGYCSDTTRTVFTGPPSPELARIYEVVAHARAAGVGAAQVGAACSGVDDAARRVISDAGFGEYFIHRTGHGIGLEAHENPYMVVGNATPLVAGHVFSVEPGIYLPGRYGVRIEDIVAATAEGPRLLNQSDRGITIID